MYPERRIIRDNGLHVTRAKNNKRPEVNVPRAKNNKRTK